MDGLQGNCNKTPSYQDRYIRLVVGDFHARLLVHIIAGNQRGHWGETHLDYDYKCLCSDERCYRRIFLRHDLPRNTPTSSDNVMLHLTRRLATTIFIACENIRFSSLFVAEDVSCGGTSATQRQKFHTDDVKSVQNPVRSADWSTEQLHCLSYCLQMTDKRPKAKKVKCKHEESLTKQSIFVQYSLL